MKTDLKFNFEEYCKTELEKCDKELRALTLKRQFIVSLLKKKEENGIQETQK